ncbi:hypothetical protein [Streptomyces coeruleorubidus]|uniref:hypothetical protein n=1 Tax=Streptomyces coeruleorubidus TaxID=116188 RepID=UPI0036558A70
MPPAPRGVLKEKPKGADTEKSRAGQPAGETGAAAGDATAGGSSEDDAVDAEIVDDDKREAG